MGECVVGAVGITRSQKIYSIKISVLFSPSGKSYVVTNQKSLVQSMESLIQKLQPGVVVNFQKIRGSTPHKEDLDDMDVNGM